MNYIIAYNDARPILIAVIDSREEKRKYALNIA